MTLQVHPSGAERGGGASTVDAYPLPFSVGNKEIVGADPDSSLIIREEDQFPGSRTNVVVESSNNVTVGNRTVFNGDVTIFQNINRNSLRTLHAGTLENDVECKKKNSSNVTKKSSTRLSLLIIFTLLIIVLIIICTTLLVFKNKIFDGVPNFPPVDPNSNISIQEFPVYLKSNWGGLLEREALSPLSSPTSLLIISHSDTDQCYNFTQCSGLIQYIQYKFLKEGHRDIGYNFLIGGDGGIYVGRGWKYDNSVRRGSITICFIGDFNGEKLTNEAKEACQALIGEGLELGNLDNDYKLIGENQTSPLRFYSPGRNVAEEISKWEHFYSGIML